MSVLRSSSVIAVAVVIISDSSGNNISKLISIPAEVVEVLITVVIIVDSLKYLNMSEKVGFIQKLAEKPVTSQKNKHQILSNTAKPIRKKYY